MIILNLSYNLSLTNEPWELVPWYFNRKWSCHLPQTHPCKYHSTSLFFNSDFKIACLYWFVKRKKINIRYCSSITARTLAPFFVLPAFSTLVPYFLCVYILLLRVCCFARLCCESVCSRKPRVFAFKLILFWPINDI